MHKMMRAVLQLVCLAGLFGLLAGGLPRSAQAQGWHKIDCSESLVTSTPMDKCFGGPVRYSNTCYFEQYAANATSQNELSHVRVLITNRQKSPLCWVSDDSNWATGFKQEDPNVSRFAQNWSPISQVAGTNGMYFELQTRKCFAFYKMSPPITIPRSSMRDKYASLYFIKGYVCGAVRNGELPETQIAGFINSIRVREP